MKCNNFNYISTWSGISCDCERFTHTDFTGSAGHVSSANIMLLGLTSFGLRNVADFLLIYCCLQIFAGEIQSFQYGYVVRATTKDFAKGSDGHVNSTNIKLLGLSCLSCTLCVLHYWQQTTDTFCLRNFYKIIANLPFLNEFLQVNFNRLLYFNRLMYFNVLHAPIHQWE